MSAHTWSTSPEADELGSELVAESKQTIENLRDEGRMCDVGDDAERRRARPKLARTAHP